MTEGRRGKPKKKGKRQKPEDEKPKDKREKNYKGSRNFIIAGIIALWLFYLGMGHLSYTKTGDWSSALTEFAPRPNSEMIF